MSEDIVRRVFVAINNWLNAGGLGVCTFIQPAHCVNGAGYYRGAVQWWPKTPPDWRMLTAMLRVAGAIDIVVDHVMYDETHGETDGRGPRGATLSFGFNGVGAEAAPGVGRWRPMAAAPRDRRVLVLSPGEVVYVAKWVKNPETGEEAWLISQCGEDQHLLSAPKGWHPLPRIEPAEGAA